MNQIYIYSVRRARINNENLCVDLIPKLFNDIYISSSEININEFIEKIKKEFNYNNNKKEFIERMLRDEKSLLNQSKKYLDILDYETIIKLNLDLIDENMTEYQFDKLIEHLYRGHDMEYGLYFTIGFAMNDDDFEDKFIKVNSENSDLTIVYYTQLNNLLNYIKQIDLEYDFINNILYLNKFWNHGKPLKNTIYLNKSEKNYTTNDIKNFKKKIKKNYSTLNIDNETELICKMPLNINLFKSFYVERGSDIYKNKYLKYKFKYKELQKKLMSIK
jgi:hypothetical protein